MRKEMRQEIELQLYKFKRDGCSPWADLISREMENMEAQRKELLQLRYIEKKPEKEICSLLHIERSTYYSWLNNIIQEIAIAAAYERLINP